MPGSGSQVRSPAARAMLRELLHAPDGLTRAELVRRTKLSRPTVFELLSSSDDGNGSARASSGNGRSRSGLSLAGLVLPTEDKQSTLPGPPAERLKLRPELGYAIGVDLGRGHVRVAVSGLDGKPMKPPEPKKGEDELDVAEHPWEALDRVGELVESVVKDVGTENLVGIGVSVAAALKRDENGKRSLLPELLYPNWRPLIKITDKLEARLPYECPIVVENDACLGAQAEHRWGAAQGDSHFAYLKWSRGIGLGLYLNGRTHLGAHGLAGEFGHVAARRSRLGDDSAECPVCGRTDCLEAVCGVSALLHQTKQSPEGLSATEKAWKGFLAVVENDKGREPKHKTKLLRGAAREIGLALGPLVSVLDLDLVVVGGMIRSEGFSLVQPDLLQGMLDSGVAPVLDAVNVVAGDRTGGAAVEGALAMVFNLPEAIDFLLDRAVQTSKQPNQQSQADRSS